MTTWWDQYVGRNPGWGHPSTHPHYTWLVDQISQPLDVLEIGYGTGQGYAAIRKNVGHYRGYDLTQSFQATCRQKFPEGDFRVASVLHIPEVDRSWDLVFCRHLLEHIQDWQDAIAEMWRVADRALVIFSWRALTHRPTFDTGDGQGKIPSLVFNKREFIQVLKRHAIPRIIALENCGPVYILSRSLTGGQHWGQTPDKKDGLAP